MSLQDDLYRKSHEIYQLADELLLHSQELLALAESLTPVNKLLAVPWVSQLGDGANYAPGDCGAACLASWLLYLGHEGVTVDLVSANVGLAPGYRYTMPAHIIRAAMALGENLYWRRGLSLADLRAEIDRGQPVIVLGHYDYLPDRYDPAYKKGHWFLIVGYSSDGFTYLDPYWPSDGRRTISTDAFVNVWDNNHLDGNSDRQALRRR